MQRGVPTAFAAPMLTELRSRRDVQLRFGPMLTKRRWGRQVEPLFDDRAGRSPEGDDALYEYLALVDAIRLGNHGKLLSRRPPQVKDHEEMTAIPRSTAGNDESLASALGEDLRSRLVFVGGCTTALFITDPVTLEDVRATDDIDLIVDLAGLPAWAQLQEELRHRASWKPLTRR